MFMCQRGSPEHTSACEAWTTTAAQHDADLPSQWEQGGVFHSHQRHRVIFGLGGMCIVMCSDVHSPPPPP